MIDVLSIVSNELTKKLKYNYFLGEYSKSKVTYPYIIGEYLENGTDTEINNKNGQIILTAFSRKKILELEEIADSIEKHFTNFFVNEDNYCVYIEYNHRLMIDSEDTTIKKIEIYLDFNKWKGE